jgi:flavin reductase (DIM6/NTAB) family NADH-FMN oxidoreductase RutF
MVYGIYILTCSRGDEMNGMIASWACQISHEPPLLAAAVHPNRYSHDLVLKGRHFALNLIPRNRKDLLSRFKGPDPAAKFDSIQWTRGKTGCPIIRECLCYMELELRDVYTPGNHTLFVGEIADAGLLLSGDPLTTLDYEGVYTGKD